ncbi:MULTISPECIES: ATP-binding protein [Bartonella]|uniref:ATP-binding protein n=1 Tax=Bartonella TaxID=773 RepID=UPI0018DC54C7|nr:MULTISPECIES: ATP-binding protein [Bartonella]MBI0169374.1 ATP-binding protein [Bartonella sp. W8167]MBI0174638.1 ATP-binding protein [Bartonella apis]
MTNENLDHKLDQLIAILSRMAPPEIKPLDMDQCDCFVWIPEKLTLNPVKHVNRIDIDLIKGVEQARDALIENTRQFANGLPANNVLLWGARGMGKSSLVKSVQAKINKENAGKLPLKLIEIHREDIGTLPVLLSELRKTPYRSIIFCDDLSFDQDDTSYKSLKAALDGGVEGRPENVVFYATSNRRHLMPREMIDNESSTAVNPSEAIEEKVSLSDRFGLWLGFHKCGQDEYLDMIDGYVRHYGLDEPLDKIHHDALEWATTRGNRSGRVAWQFIMGLAGRLGKKLD